MRRLQLVPMPVLACVIGLAYVFGDPRRYTSPSFNTARRVAAGLGYQGDGLHLWGVLFLAGALVMTTCLLTNSASTMAIALTIGGFIYTWWAMLFAVSAIREPFASLIGWAVYLFVAYGHFINAYRIRTGATP